MAKIKKAFTKSFKISLDSSKSETQKEKIKKINIDKFFYFFIDIFSNLFKIILYIFISIFISIGATAIFNAEVRELILELLK